MITLKEFKKIIKEIKNFNNKNDIISKALINDCTGFVDYGFPLLDIIEDLLNKCLNIKDKSLISWWLYEKVDKIIIYEDGTQKNLNKIEDFYDYIVKEYNI